MFGVSVMRRGMMVTPCRAQVWWYGGMMVTPCRAQAGYHFKCECVACSHKWPVYDRLVTNTPHNFNNCSVANIQVND